VTRLARSFRAAVDPAPRRSSFGCRIEYEEDAMKYLLFICADESVEVSPVEADAGAWVEQTRGVRLDGNRLRPVADATTVRVRGGETLVTDGPFAETKEQIAGYDVLECADLDEAIEVASRHPVARFGTVEVRPFWQE
jgi:hypothetical protein